MRNLTHAGRWVSPLSFMGTLAITGCVIDAPRIAASHRTLLTEVEQKAPPALADSKEFRRALAAMATVRRKDFVPRTLRKAANAERPEPIGYEQTISSPYIVALMTAAANPKPGERVLEVGTGSGYQAAVLSRLAQTVYTIEIVEPLAKTAAERLSRLGYANVRTKAGDGFAGWPEAAPFNAILVTAGAADPPEPLLAQLAIGGRLVMPIGPSTVQEKLMLVTKRADGTFSRCVLGIAMFVPLTGKGERPDRLMGISERGIPYCYGEDVGAWYFVSADQATTSKGTDR